MKVNFILTYLEIKIEDKNITKQKKAMGRTGKQFMNWRNNTALKYHTIELKNIINRHRYNDVKVN
jgi:hypothetical protein